MSKFYPFILKKLSFKLIFKSISGNCDPLLSKINFNHTHSFGGGGGGKGILSRGFLSGGSA